MKLKNILLAIWELPQNVLGFIVKKIFKAKRHPFLHMGDNTVYTWSINGGMSLGKYIFVPDTYNEDTAIMLFHEYGHSIQSKYLGWFYLLVIGLPSLIWANCFGWYRKKTGKSYYWFYTERWANKLAGIEVYK